MESEMNTGQPRQHPFRVPDGYFDTLEDRVMARMKSETTKTPRRLTALRVLKPVWGIVAMFVMATIVTQWVAPRLMDPSRMILHPGVPAVQEQADGSVQLDADFNPTREEIIEYLAQEADVTELLLTGNF